VLQPFALPAGGNDVENRWSFLRFFFFASSTLSDYYTKYGPVFWSFDFLTWVNSTVLVGLNTFKELNTWKMLWFLWFMISNLFCYSEWNALLNLQDYSWILGWSS
jgi:hypothetical protein